MACLIPYLHFGQGNTDSTWISYGGAVRFNTLYAIYEHKTFDLPTENRNGLFWDMFRLEVQAGHKRLGVTFEYRFYPGFNTNFIKKGFMTYRHKDHQLFLGITQVPFGMLEILGNSWWFQLPYYVGLEDDYDTGIVYRFTKGLWDFHVAYFLMAEPRGVSDPAFGNYMSARYSYDVIPEDGYNGNKERNQGNLRAEYARKGFLAGISLQAGEIYNSNLSSSFLHWALAIHSTVELTSTIQARIQISHYKYVNSITDEGQPAGSVNLGAYGFGTYKTAGEATIFSLGFSYRKSVDWGPISAITLYDDYSFMNKYGNEQTTGLSFKNTHQNVLGFLLESRYVYAYFDIASGINQPWLSDAFGGPALSSGRGENVYESVSGQNPPDQQPPFNTRFNINLGIYFMK